MYPQEFPPELDSVRRAFLNMEVQVTPRDPHGPYRFNGKVTGVSMNGEAVELTIRVLRTIDARWQQGNDVTIYFHTNTSPKKWSLSRNVTPSSELMVERPGMSFLKNKEEYKAYGLSVTGDEVRALIKSKFSVRFELYKSVSQVGTYTYGPSIDVIGFLKGAEFRYMVNHLLKKHPTAFRHEEREMICWHLSEYTLFD